MIQDIIRHKFDYAVLALCSVTYILSFLAFQYNSQALLLFTVAYGAVYVLWGIFHHLHTRSFHKKVVLEYLLVSLFAIILVSTLLI